MTVSTTATATGEGKQADLALARLRRARGYPFLPRTGWKACGQRKMEGKGLGHERDNTELAKQKRQRRAGRQAHTERNNILSDGPFRAPWLHRKGRYNPKVVRDKHGIVGWAVDKEAFK